MTPLSRAALNGHADICSLFLAYWVKDSPDTASEPSANPSIIIDKDDIKLALLMTVNSPCGAQVLKTLDQHGVDVFAKELNSYNPFTKACSLGHFGIVEAFLDIARRTETIPTGIDDCLGRIGGRSKTAACLLDFKKEKDEERAQEIMNEILVTAVHNNREALVRVLLERGAEATGQLVEACSHKPVNMAIVKLLVKHGADIQARAKDERATPLTKAAGNGDLECVRYLVERGAKVNVGGPRNTSPLMFAARGGYLSCVDWLLEHGAEVNWRDDFGESALFEAASGKHFEVTELLLDRGADAAGRGWGGRNVLQLCLDSPATMKKVLERHPAVNMPDDDGLAPIHFAALEKRADAIPLLVQFGAEVDTAGPDVYDGNAPLAMAVISADLATVQNLLEAGAEVDRTAWGHGGCSALHHAPTAEIIAALLQYGPYVDMADDDGETALHHLTSTVPPDLAAIKTLVRARANVNLQDKKGRTPLFDIVLNASSSSSSSDLVVAHLLSKNADPNIPTLLDSSRFREACKLGNLPLAKQLHAAGANVDVGTGDLCGSPLQAVCLAVNDDRDAIEIIRFLVDEAKAGVNYVCGRYGTALSAACLRGSPDVFNVLLDEYKANPRLPDWAGRLPVHLAASTQLGAFRQLVGLGCCDDDAGVVDKTGRTLLHWAARSANVEMVELALSQTSVEVDEADGDGWTALCWAARGPTSNPVVLQQQQTMSPKDWETAVSRQTGVIKLLLERGAKKSVAQAPIPIRQGARLEQIPQA